MQLTTSSSSSDKPLSANNLLKLVQLARVSAESLLLLGLGLPASECPFSLNQEAEEKIDLDLAVFDSKEILKRKLGIQFNIKRQTEKLIDIANMPQSRKKEKESHI